VPFPVRVPSFSPFFLPSRFRLRQSSHFSPAVAVRACGVVVSSQPESRLLHFPKRDDLENIPTGKGTTSSRTALGWEGDLGFSR
jgi:hypothetical protein